MPTYPLTFPTPQPASATFRLVRASSKSVSPFTFREQIYLHPGERWEGVVEWPPMTQDKAAEIQSFYLELQGQFGTFLYGDPNYLAKGARGLATGSPLVNGAGQTGNTLVVDGLTPSLTGWLKKGDYFQLGSGTAARLYQVSQDVNTDGSGEATLTFWPAIRSSPADNQAVIINGAKGLFRAATGSSELTVTEGNFYSTSFAFVEAIGE